MDVCKKPELYILIFDCATTILSSKIQILQFFRKLDYRTKIVKTRAFSGFSDYFFPRGSIIDPYTIQRSMMAKKGPD